eukprot:TRINITY_DN6869_c0_g1_i1.p1 TRINITY_DN6869_c0_g1~~TRINITY_DN6869_c0_g1_i1.p1  ORF type:complete len:378 (+),score=103.85 TRINITY_DN6869_c0_g1_i1:87-1220(+)
MRSIYSLLFASLLVSFAASQSQTYNLNAGASVDASANFTNSLFGGTSGAFVVSAIFQNGGTKASVTFSPVLLTADASLSAFATGSDFVASSALSATTGFSITSDVTGSGTLTIALSSNYVASKLATKSRLVLASTPSKTSAQAQTNAGVVFPVTSFSSTNVVTFSIAYGRNYFVTELSSTSAVGLNPNGNFLQAAFNTTAQVTKGTYVAVSASGNAGGKLNTNSGSASTSNSNEYLLFANTDGNTVSISASQFYLGSTSGGATFLTPVGTNNNLGCQFSLSASTTDFKGNLSYVSNGKNFDSSKSSQFSWFKAQKGLVGDKGWTKVASTSNVDASGNLVVTTRITNGEFSEWTVAVSTGIKSLSIASLVLVVLFLTL